MLEKVIDLRCPRISLETGCTIRCVLGFTKFRGVTYLVFFCIHDQYLLLGFSVRQVPVPPYRKPVAPLLGHVVIRSERRSKEHKNHEENT